MRWACTKVESEYMKLNQAKNLVACKSSKAESWMLEKLRKTPFKWTRQARWGYRLFDFWSHELGICVEVDGPEHNKEYDQIRDKYNYCRSAIVVLRVRNFNEDDASKAIKEILSSETWQERKKRIKPGKKLLLANGLKMARSAAHLFRAESSGIINKQRNLCLKT